MWVADIINVTKDSRRKEKSMANYDHDSRAEYLSPYKYLDGIENFIEGEQGGAFDYEYTDIGKIIDSADYEI
ncbi:MAG: hypothetical protein II399_05525 [Lachnospiraceae bacterium]|nr:hypothetical protein [Lachnospiraceae bacterium]